MDTKVKAAAIAVTCSALALAVLLAAAGLLSPAQDGGQEEQPSRASRGTGAAVIEDEEFYEQLEEEAAENEAAVRATSRLAKGNIENYGFLEKALTKGQLAVWIEGVSGYFFESGTGAVSEMKLHVFEVKDVEEVKGKKRTVTLYFSNAADSKVYETAVKGKSVVCRECARAVPGVTVTQGEYADMLASQHEDESEDDGVLVDDDQGKAKRS